MTTQTAARWAASVLLPIAAAGASPVFPIGQPAVGAAAGLELPDGMSIAVEFPRYLQLARRIEAIIDNQSDVAVTVVDLALRSPLFEPIEADDAYYTVRPGLRQDLDLGLGESICPPADVANGSAGVSTLEMTVEIDGERRHGVVEIDPTPIERINTSECGQRLVLEATELSYGPEFDAVDGAVRTTITLNRRSGDEPITLTDARGSVLFVVQPIGALEPGEPLAVMASGEPFTAAAITINVGRCEPHAVADAKKPFAFAVWVSLGAGDPYFVTLAPEGEIRAALEGLLQECVAAGSAVS